MIAVLALLPLAVFCGVALGRRSNRKPPSCELDLYRLRKSRNRGK